MSEEIQRDARDRRDRAAERERRAHERAERNRAAHDDLLAGLHDAAAEGQSAAADKAERDRVADVAIEGNRLAGEPDGPARPGADRPPAPPSAG